MSLFLSDGKLTLKDGQATTGSACCCCARLPDSLSIAVGISPCNCIREDATHVFTYDSGGPGVYTIPKTSDFVWSGTGHFSVHIFELLTDGGYPNCEGELVGETDLGYDLDITITCDNTNGELTVLIHLEDPDNDVFMGVGKLNTTIDNTLAVECNGNAFIPTPGGSTPVGTVTISTP